MIMRAFQNLAAAFLLSFVPNEFQRVCIETSGLRSAEMGKPLRPGVGFIDLGHPRGYPVHRAEKYVFLRAAHWRAQGAAHLFLTFSADWA